MKKVEIFIIGGQKCGTTALHSFLSQHPNIKPGAHKEIDFFNYDKLYNKGLNYYHSIFELNFYERYLKNLKLIDASPSYLTDQLPEITAERIYNYNHNAKIIVIVRNPLERAFSAYMMYKNRFNEGRKDWWFEWTSQRGLDTTHYLKRSNESYESFDKFIDEELNAITLNKKIECSVLPSGNYIKFINNYSKFFNNVLVISNEFLNQNTDKAVYSIIKYLNLKSFKPNKFKGKKVFKGNYDENISNKTYLKLSTFYEESNSILLKDYGINYL